MHTGNKMLERVMGGAFSDANGKDSIRLNVENEKHQSDVINIMRFPLIVMVVLFHLYPPEENIGSPFGVYNAIATFFSAKGIAQLAVPAFFLISGYFFFYRLKEWNSGIYIGKLRKRIHTLLIPYLLWNTIPLIGIILMRLFMGMMNGNPTAMVREFGDSTGWLRALWDSGVEGGKPFDVPLWYVRDLMVCTVFTPVIYFLIKKTGMIYIAVMTLLFLTDTWIGLSGFSSRAWFFFSFGAFLCLNNINMVLLYRRYSWIIIPVALALLIITVYMGTYNHAVHCLYLFFGIAAMMTCFSFIVSKGLVRNVPFLTKSVFFIFAFHLFPLPGITSVTAFVWGMTERMIVETQVLPYFVQLIVAPVAVVGICLMVYHLMLRFTPRVLYVLTGQR